MDAILLVGLNHRTAPLEIRERVHVSEGQAATFLTPLREAAGDRGVLYADVARALFGLDGSNCHGRGPGPGAPNLAAGGEDISATVPAGLKKRETT